MLDAPDADELDEVVAFVVAQQRQPDRNIAYLGTEPDGVVAELAGLTPPWTSTARVLREDGRVVGVVGVEWDEEIGRSWIMGPWVAHGGDRWLELGGRLLDAALAQVPPDVTRHELSGDLANQHLAALAGRRGWSATEPNHILSVDAEVVAGWPDDDLAGLRPAVASDLDGIRALHDAEFPGTYASASQLVAGQRDGSRTTLVVDAGDGAVAAYGSGHVDDDGQGCLDFVAVHPDHRGRGLGRKIVAAVVRDLLPRSPAGAVSLTVQDHRAPARALYRHLGFRAEGVLVGYRSWEP